MYMKGRKEGREGGKFISIRNDNGDLNTDPIDIFKDNENSVNNFSIFDNLNAQFS